MSSIDAFQLESKMVDDSNFWGTTIIQETIRKHETTFRIVIGLLVDSLVLGRHHPPSSTIHRSILTILYIRCCRITERGSGNTGNAGNATRNEDSGQEEEGPLLKMLRQTSMRQRIENYQHSVKTKMTTTSHKVRHNDATTSTSMKSTPIPVSKIASMIMERFKQRSTQDDVESSSHRQKDGTVGRGSASCTQPPRSMDSNRMDRVPVLCGVCTKTIYITDTFIHWQGRPLHASCFSCRLCHTKLQHHPMEVLLPTDHIHDDDDTTFQSVYCICSKCRLESMYAHTPKILATTAGERIHVMEDEIGNVQGVKELIGDELEEILLDRSVPRCAICQKDFLNDLTSRICIVGSIKYHAECFEMGRPAPTVRTPTTSSLMERPLHPYQAAKYIPERWIVRLVIGAGKSNKTPPLMTLFFEWNTKQEDLAQWKRHHSSTKSSSPWTTKSFMISFVLEDDAATISRSRSQPSQQGQEQPQPQRPPRRRKTKSLPVSVLLESVQCELVGNPLSALLTPISTATAISVVQSDNNHDCVTMLEIIITVVRFQVNHQIQLTIPMIPTTGCRIPTPRPPENACTNGNNGSKISMPPTEVVALDSSAAQLSVVLRDDLRLTLSV